MAEFEVQSDALADASASYNSRSDSIENESSSATLPASADPYGIRRSTTTSFGLGLMSGLGALSYLLWPAENSSPPSLAQQRFGLISRIVLQGYNLFQLADRTYSAGKEFDWNPHDLKQYHLGGQILSSGMNGLASLTYLFAKGWSLLNATELRMYPWAFRLSTLAGAVSMLAGASSLSAYTETQDYNESPNFQQPASHYLYDIFSGFASLSGYPFVNSEASTAVKKGDFSKALAIFNGREINFRRDCPPYFVSQSVASLFLGAVKFWGDVTYNGWSVFGTGGGALAIAGSLCAINPPSALSGLALSAAGHLMLAAHAQNISIMDILPELDSSYSQAWRQHTFLK